MINKIVFFISFYINPALAINDGCTQKWGKFTKKIIKKII